MKSDKVEDVYPLTPMQRGMLFHTLYAPESGVYVLQFSCTFQGALDRDAFQAAWQHVVEQNPILRTAIVWRRAEEPKQVVLRKVPVVIEDLDWSDLDEATQRDRFDALIERDKSEGFRLTKPPLMRLRLVRMGERTHRFLWSKHHLLLDGWSHQLVMSQALTAYVARLRGAELPIVGGMKFGDYVRWVEQQDRGEAEAAWQRVLSGFTAPNRLHVDRNPGLSHGQAGDYDQQSFSLPDDVVHAVRERAKLLDVTTNTMFQGAWAILLRAYSGESDTVFGATASGRSIALPGIETSVGMFINTLPVRVNVDPAAEVSSWLKGLQQQQVSLRDFEYAPVADVKRWSDVPDGKPLFESIVVYENYPVAADFARSELEATADVRVEDVLALERINYPLTIVVVPQTLDFVLAYDRRRFSDATIAAFSERFVSILAAMGKEGATVRDALRLPPSERAAVLRMAAGPDRAWREASSVVSLIRDAAAQGGERPALVGEGETWSYAELWKSARRIGQGLRRQGVVRGDRVGILLGRSHAMVASMLGVLCAGAAFVPLDPNLPGERLTHYAADAQVAAVLSTPSLSEAFPKALHAEELAADASLDGPDSDTLPTPDDLAYLIYTSGSTGTPKAVLLTHRGLLNTSLSLADGFDIRESSRVLQFASVGFDGCVGDVFSCLVAGATLVLSASDAAASASRFRDQLRAERVTNLTAPPSFLRLIDPVGLDDLRVVATVGEACPRALVERWRPGRRLINGYGPTEVAITATLHDTHVDEDSPPIGRPIPHVRVYVLDESLELVAPGIAGQLYIAGPGVAWGYHGRPGLTATRFLPDPFGPPGSRMYASGDVVRLRPDGNLEFVGRQDHQVKVRGYRVELQEIEEAIAAEPWVREAAVVVRRHAEGDSELLAFVSHRPGATEDVASLRASLGRRLPDYMVPSTFVALEALPRNSSDKVDRRALSDWQPEASEQEASTVAAPVALSPTEEMLLEIWRRVLRKADLRVTDDFFDVAGGDSLLAVRMVSEVEKRLDRQIEVSDVFEHPTVASLAKILDGESDEEPAGEDPLADYALADDIRALPGEPPLPPRRPLLTGATGFLGAHILAALLDGDAEHVHCIVRAADEASALERLTVALRREGVWKEGFEAKIVPLVGDLALPRLGLSTEAYATARDRVDAIFHCGALVNYLYPDERLIAPNVAGTEEVLRLACAGVPKVVHHVSTLGVFAGQLLGRTISEDQDLVAIPAWPSYARSKWSAERLATEAQARGVPVVIHRPGDIGGSARTGRSNAADILCLTLQACIRIGAVPGVGAKFDIAPVDYVSRAIVEIAQHREAVGGRYHLNNPVEVPLDTIRAVVAAMGYALEPMPYADWREQLRRLGAEDESLSRLVALWPADAVPAAIEALPPQYDCRRTTSLLDPAGVRCPEVDEDVIRRYVSFFQAEKLIPSP